MAYNKTKRAAGIPGTGALVEVDRIMDSSTYQSILIKAFRFPLERREDEEEF